MTPRLEKVLSEVEASSKRPMFAVQNPAAKSVCLFDPFCEDQIQYKTTLTEECCIHELMHAKLWFSGFPYLSLVSLPGTSILGHISVMLNGIFHHHIMLKKLEAIGLDLKQSEEKGARRFIKLLGEAEPHKIRERHFLALSSIVFARAKLHTSLLDIEMLFDLSHLFPAKAKGEQLSEMVCRHAVENVIVFNQGLEKTLELLQLKEQFQYKTANVA